MKIYTSTLVYIYMRKDGWQKCDTISLEERSPSWSFQNIRVGDTSRGRLFVYLAHGCFTQLSAVSGIELRECHTFLESGSVYVTFATYWTSAYLLRQLWLCTYLYYVGQVHVCLHMFKYHLCRYIDIILSMWLSESVPFIHVILILFFFSLTLWVGILCTYVANVCLSVHNFIHVYQCLPCSQHHKHW